MLEFIHKIISYVISELCNEPVLEHGVVPAQTGAAGDVATPHGGHASPVPERGLRSPSRWPCSS